MTNTEIKVGDLVTWVDRVECAEDLRGTGGLVVGAKAFDPTAGRALPAPGPLGLNYQTIIEVRWLNGPRRGDTLLVRAEYLALLSDPKNKKESA